MEPVMEFTSAGVSLGDGETRAAGHIAGMRRGSWARDQLDLCVSVVATGVVLVLSHTIGLVVGFIACVLRLDRVVRRAYRWFADRHPAWLWGDIGSLVPERAAVLDVGAGSCLMARAIRDMRQAHLSCVDIEHRLGTDLPVAVFDGVHLPFPDRSFDVVLMSYVLHHAARPADLLRDCARVCRGRVVVVEDLPLFGRRFFEWGHHRTYNCLVRRPDGIRYGEIRLHFDREWRGLFAGAGLRVAGQRIRWSSGSFPMMRAIYELEPVATPLTESSSES